MYQRKKMKFASLSLSSKTLHCTLFCIVIILTIPIPFSIPIRSTETVFSYLQMCVYSSIRVSCVIRLSFAEIRPVKSVFSTLSLSLNLPLLFLLAHIILLFTWLYTYVCV